MRIIYGVMNAIGGVWCERVFAPWGDMEGQMRENGLLLYGLESGDPVKDFDFIAFSVGYELSYTNILNMLDLAGIPPRRADRGISSPLVIAGGACCYNPEPLADFIDLFVIGEGEEVAGEIIAAYRNAYKTPVHHGPGIKRDFLESASTLKGVYVPSLYDVVYNADGTVNAIQPRGNAPLPVVKRMIGDLDSAFFPVETIIPSTGQIHDRVTIELFRGCKRGCRFCQAGMVNRPVRARSCETLVRQGIGSLQLSGYDEVSLLSLSSSDYAQIGELCDNLMGYCEPRRIGLALPSLRADNFSAGLMHKVQKVRKSGLTFAPEAGSRRLRDAINKNVDEEDFLDTCRIVFEGGWSAIKLYFMLGLPSETDSDVIAIAELAESVLNIWRMRASNKSRGVRITVSTSCFIPKPHTPFQWEAQVPMVEYLRRVRLLKNSIRSKSVTYNWHSPEQGYIEAALSRGDRRTGAVVEAVWRSGARFDSWSEHFSLDKWLQAYISCGLDPGFYATRERSRDEVLPWGVVTPGVSAGYLWDEYMKSKANMMTPDCGESCSGCGACVPRGPNDPRGAGKSVCIK